MILEIIIGASFGGIVCFGIWCTCEEFKNLRN